MSVSINCYDTNAITRRFEVNMTLIKNRSKIYRYNGYGLPFYYYCFNKCYLFLSDFNRKSFTIKIYKCKM